MGDQKTTEVKLQEAYDRFMTRMLALKLEKLEVIRKSRESLDTIKLAMIDENFRKRYLK